jgi:hypothetical protein
VSNASIVTGFVAQVAASAIPVPDDRVRVRVSLRQLGNPMEGNRVMPAVPAAMRLRADAIAAK